MTATLEATQAPTPRATTPRTSAPRKAGRRPRGATLATGVVFLWVGVIVALPLAALTVASLADGPAGFLEAISAPGAIAAVRTSLVLSVIVAGVNAVAGTVIAWVLVRDSFPGKSLANAIIDLPFALPTIVTSIVLLSLYGPQSPVGIHLNGTPVGVAVALAFVTLPFVVRSVQPVFDQLDREAEEAAASLGAGNLTTARRVVWPAIRPAVISGTALAFARSMGEFGAVALIGGNLPGITQVTSQYIAQRIEIGDPAGAAAVSVTLLAISVVVLVLLRLLARDRRGQEVR
ncbi:MAG: ABC transporter permease subunit [Propionicimonas sp.]